MLESALCTRAKDALTRALGSRLVKVIHYGSTARGDAREDSDIDLLVVLKGPISLGADLDTIVGAIYPVQLEAERPIHALPVDYADYEAGSHGLYRTAKRDGVAL